MNHNDSTTEDPDFLTKGMPEKLGLLRQKLHKKAKQNPKFRFYVLYDRIYRMDTLETAWKLVKRNKGAAGIDGVSIDSIASGNLENFLKGIQGDLKSKSYRPSPVKRVLIPKANGKSRPLGIPTVKDRVVQTAALLILEPIFEADFEQCSFGFRPEKSAHDALKSIHDQLRRGYTTVYDADLESYFDTIPHDKLMNGVKTRISDGSVLRLIEMWLKAVIVDRDDNDKPRYRRPKRGTPQGGVLSPLLANSFLHWFDREISSPYGLAKKCGARLTRYCDDFVITAKYLSPKLVNYIEYLIEDRLGLKINREKTSIVNLKDYGASLDFLGYTFRFDRDLKGNGHRYLFWGTSKKSLARARSRIKEMTAPNQCFKPLPRLAIEISRFTRGWSNYFSLGYKRRSYNSLNHYIGTRMLVHLDRRSQRGYKFPKGARVWDHLSNFGIYQL